GLSRGQLAAAAPSLVHGVLGGTAAAMPQFTGGPSDLPDTEAESATTETPTTSTTTTTTTEAPRLTAGPYAREIAGVSKLTNVPQELLRSVIEKESSYRQRAVGSDAPSQGLMQILPSTWQSKRLGERVEQLVGRPASLLNP